MTVSFQLTMPNVGSWNGQWTGASRAYFVIKRFSKKGTPWTPSSDRIKELLNGKERQSWHYSWNDGWGANVSMEIVTAAEANKRRKASSGFCGYEWMIDDILKHGKILGTIERKALEANKMEVVNE